MKKVGDLKLKEQRKRKKTEIEHVERKRGKRCNVSARQILNSTLCIDLSYIRKHGIIEKRPYATHGTIRTVEGHQISFQSNYGNEEHCNLEINYSVSYERSYQLTVGLLEVSSNLRKGYLLFLICPATGRKCRKLYKLPFSDKWGSRAAFRGQLYYHNQTCSHLQKYAERYFNIKAKYNKLQKLRPTKLYDGKETKRYIKSLDLLESKEKAYKALWSQDATPVAVQKLIPKELIEGLMYSRLFQ